MSVNNKCWQGQRNWNPHTLLMGMQNGAAVVEDGVVVTQMVKYKVTM